MFADASCKMKVGGCTDLRHPPPLIEEKAYPHPQATRMQS